MLTSASHLILALGALSYVSMHRVRPRSLSKAPQPSNTTTMMCSWDGPSGSDACLSFPLTIQKKSESPQSVLKDACVFACNREKFAKFMERFHTALEAEPVEQDRQSGGKKCRCYKAGQSTAFFTFKILTATEAFCNPAKCWEVYTRQWDVGKDGSQKLGLQGNYRVSCKGGAVSEQAAPVVELQPIRRTTAELEEIAQAAANVGSGEIDAVQARAMLADQIDFTPDDSASWVPDTDEAPVQTPEQNGGIHAVCEVTSVRYKNVWFTNNALFSQVLSQGSTTCGSVTVLSESRFTTEGRKHSDVSKEVALQCFEPTRPNEPIAMVGGVGICAIPKKAPCFEMDHDEGGCAPGLTCHLGGPVLYMGLLPAGYATSRSRTCEEVHEEALGMDE